MDTVTTKLAEEKSTYSWDQTNSVSVGFCCGLCELLVDAGDSSLVSLFFATLFSQLKQQEHKEALIPAIFSVVRTFDWNEIGQAVLNSLNGAVDDTGMGFSLYARAPTNTDFEMTLRLADGLEPGAAQQALLNAVVEKANCLSDKVLCSSKSISLLWKWAIRCEYSNTFNSVAARFKRADPSLLHPVVEAFSQHLSGIDAADDKFAVLAFIAALRTKWLSLQLQALRQPFSWEMPNAQFADNARVQAFLRGPDVTMNTIGVRSFNGIKHARNYVAKWMREKQINASFELELEGRGQDAYVVITKTRTWFASHQKELLRYQSERQTLMEPFDSSADSGASERKRPRLN